MKMLQGFERHTYDLTPYEIQTLVPCVVEILSQAKGEDRALKSPQVLEQVRTHGLKLDERRLRKIVGAIRLSGNLPCLCATERGYFVAASPEEADRTIRSLEQRASENARLARALSTQRVRQFGQPQMFGA